MKILELICERCDKDYPIWYADNDIWNKVIRDEVAGDCFDFLCPTCFIIRASMKGITPIWRLTYGEHQPKK